MSQRAYLKHRDLTSHPASNGKVRKHIRQMLRIAGLDPEKVLKNNGLLDSEDCHTAQQTLMRKPKCGIKIVIKSA